MYDLNKYTFYQRSLSDICQYCDFMHDTTTEFASEIVTEDATTSSGVVASTSTAPTKREVGNHSAGMKVLSVGLPLCVTAIILLILLLIILRRRYRRYKISVQQGRVGVLFVLLFNFFIQQIKNIYHCICTENAKRLFKNKNILYIF